MKLYEFLLEICHGNFEVCLPQLVAAENPEEAEAFAERFASDFLGTAEYEGGWWVGDEAIWRVLHVVEKNSFTAPVAPSGEDEVTFAVIPSNQLAVSAVHFRVKVYGSQARVEWHIGGVTDLASFLYWAFSYGARYTVHFHKGGVELEAVQGTLGELKGDLFFDVTENPHPYRIFPRRSAHRITQHGLDGFPVEAYLVLPRDTPIFRVEIPGEGAFSLTLNDWERFFSLGEDGDISKLATF